MPQRSTEINVHRGLLPWFPQGYLGFWSTVQIVKLLQWMERLLTKPKVLMLKRSLSERILLAGGVATTPSLFSRHTASIVFNAD